MSGILIKEQKDFDRIIRTGKSANTSVGRIKFVINAINKPKMGIIIGKKQGLNSVQRNRIRRIFKEAWRQIVQDISTPVEFVVFPYRQDYGLKTTKIREILAGFINVNVIGKNG